MKLEQIQDLVEAARHLEGLDAQDLLIEAALALSEHTNRPRWLDGYHRLSDDQRRAQLAEVRDRAALVLIDHQDRARIRWADASDALKVA